MSYNLTGATVSSTYGRIVQVVHGTPDLYYDGFGNLLELGAGTSSIGPAGTSGTSGFNGTSGTSGMGTSGTSGTSGLTGTSGTSGVDGTSGIDGTNGTSGLNGTSGTSGLTGTNGTSGLTGTSGTSGLTGTSGTTGTSGSSGTGFNSILNPSDYRILTSTGSSTSSALANTGLTYDGSSLSVHGGSVSDVKFIDFTLATASSNTGRVWFDNVERSISYYPDSNQDVIVRTGQQLYTRVYNLSGSDIPRGSAVSIISGTAGYPNVSLAISSGTNKVVGLAADNIPNNNIGLVLNNGLLTNINLTSYQIGNTLYLSDTTPGSYVSTTSTLNYSSRTHEIGYIIDNSVNGRLYVNINNEDTNLSITDIQRNTLEGNVISTGIFDFQSPGISLNTTTKFNVAPAKGWVVKNTGTYSTNPSVQIVEYLGETGVTASYLNTSTITYLLLNSNSQIVQQNTFPTPQQRRENIYLGKIGHVDRATLTNVFNEPDIEYSPLSQMRDMFTPIKLINQGVYPSANGGNLNFNTSAGTLWGLGIGSITNQLNPSSISIPGKSPATFEYRTQLGGTYSSTSLVDPTKWDNGGVLTTITGAAKQATNQRIFLLQNGLIRVQYGQHVYADLTTAISNIQTETFTTFSNFANNGILIGVLSVASNTSNLSDITYARFFLVSKFGELIGAAGGVSTTTLQQAYNNSSDPEIVTNSVLDGVTFRRGTNSDTDNVFAVQNGSASNTFYVRGDGNTWASSLHLTNIGLTSGATKYMVVNDSGDVFYQTTIVGGGGATGPAGPTGAGGALGYYGSFYDNTNQLNPTASVARTMTINSTYESNGVSIVDGDKMKFDYPGTYNIQFSTVFTKSNANSGIADVWFARNGQYITASNTSFSIAGQSDQISSWNFITSLNSNDYIQLYWSSNDTNISILATGTQSTPDRPSVPSVILTAQQVMYTQLGATGSNGTSGTSGLSGTSGTSGTSGLTGTSGSSGSSGTSGLNGTSGTSGIDGLSGTSGYSGNDGSNSGRWMFTSSITSPDNPGTSLFGIDDPDLRASNSISVSTYDIKSVDYYSWWSLALNQYSLGNYLTIQITQVNDNSIIGIFRLSDIKDNGTYFDLTIIPISGNGSLRNGEICTISFNWNGLDGLNGTSGTSGLDGTSGTSGRTGTSGTSGLTGTSGTSGLTGTSGTSGLAGTSGTSGLTGTSGTSGLTGTSGTSGVSGTSGTSGAAGTSGTSAIGIGTGTASQLAYYINSGSVSSTGNITVASNLVTVTTPMSVTSSSGGALISITGNNANGGWITLNNFGGSAPPTFTTRSLGTKFVLYETIGTSSAGYAFGVAPSTLWYGVDTQSSSHKWYAGSTLISTLDGYGNFSTIAGFLSTATYSGSYTNGTVVDYATGVGRISVGTNNNISLYTGGIGNTVISTFGTSSIILYRPTTISGNLSVIGTQSVSGNITATGSISVFGNGNINGTLFSGTHSVLGNISATGSLSVTNTIIAGTISAINQIDATSFNTATYKIATFKALDGPAFSSYGSVATTLNNGVVSKITLDTEEFDSDNAFNTSTYRFTPTLAGYYLFHGHISVITYASNTGSQIMSLYKNGYEYKRGVRVPCNTSGVGTMISAMIFMDGITDYIEMYGLQGSGGSVTTEIGQQFGPYLQGNFVKPPIYSYISVQYLVIGGGGGGGCNWGGGGGGGAFVEGTSGFAKGFIYDIIVGNGGSGATTTGAGENGGSSTIIGVKYTSTTFTITASGGGGGGYNSSGSTAVVGNSNGNSSGGGAGFPGSGGTVAGGSGINAVTIEFQTINSFNSGGQSRGISTYGPGGGGGAGATGTEGQNSQAGGNGGAGKTSSITGTSVYYSAGGGGGGGNGSVQSSGGTGNTGGKGGNTTGGAGSNGAGGYGMGGGGGATNGGTGGNGSKGVVIFRTLTSTNSSATGTYTTTTDGLYTIFTFTGNGQFIA